MHLRACRFSIFSGGGPPIPPLQEGETPSRTLPMGGFAAQRRNHYNLYFLGFEDDSDTNSVCSISTCPGDLGVSKLPAKMPSFNKPRSLSSSEEGRRKQKRPPPKVQPPPLVPTASQTSKPVASVKPFGETAKKAAGRYTNRQSYGIRDRPPAIFGAYRLCKYYRLQQPCFQGERCSYAHSEEERKAWEEDRKKGT